MGIADLTTDERHRHGRPRRVSINVPTVRIYGYLFGTRPTSDLVLLTLPDGCVHRAAW